VSKIKEVNFADELRLYRLLRVLATPARNAFPTSDLILAALEVSFPARRE
jgi:hypothetical protein